MTSRSKAFFVLLPAIVLGLAVSCGEQTAPAGQPPLADLNSQSLAAFKDQFNLASDQVRIILLLSPT